MARGMEAKGQGDPAIGMTFPTGIGHDNDQAVCHGDSFELALRRLRLWAKRHGVTMADEEQAVRELGWMASTQARHWSDDFFGFGKNLA